MEGPDQRNRHTGQRQHQSTCSSHGNRCLNSMNQAAAITAMRNSHPMAAYDYVIRGKILHHRVTREDNAEARELLDKAIELDPE